MTLPTQLPKIQDAAVDSRGQLSPRFYNPLQNALKTLQSQVDALTAVSGAVTDPTTGEIADVASQLNALKFSLGTLISSTGTGLLARTSANYAFRTLQDTANITWTNPDGVAGDPSGDLTTITPGTAATLQKTAFDAYGRRTNEAAATTDDLPEGSTNLYYTDTRARTAAIAPTLVQTGETFVVPANKQVLFSLPITVDGTLQVDGYLVEV